MEATPASYTPAHEFFAAVAPFRAWRGSQSFIAGEPTRVTIKTRRALSPIARGYSSNLFGFLLLLCLLGENSLI